MWNSYIKVHTVQERYPQSAACRYGYRFGCRNDISPGRSRVRRWIVWWNTLKAPPPKAHLAERHTGDVFDLWQPGISVTRRRSVYRGRQTPKGCGGRSIRFTLVCPDRVWPPAKHDGAPIQGRDATTNDCEGYHLYEAAQRMLNGANVWMFSLIPLRWTHEEESSPSFDIMEAARTSRRRWLGHILWMSDDRLVRRTQLAFLLVARCRSSHGIVASIYITRHHNSVSSKIMYIYYINRIVYKKNLLLTIATDEFQLTLIVDANIRWTTVLRSSIYNWRLWSVWCIVLYYRCMLYHSVRLIRWNTSDKAIKWTFSVFKQSHNKMAPCGRAIITHLIVEAVIHLSHHTNTLPGGLSTFIFIPSQ